MAITTDRKPRPGSFSDEETPLLADALSVDPELAASTNNDGKRTSVEEDQPLPKAKLIMLCYARMVEPIVFFAIFPFINKMVQDNGNLDEADVGFYSGLIESLFSVTQMIVMMFWGHMADKVGRKPVLVVSLLGVAVTSSFFGFAQSIWQMVVFRCLAGIFAGSIVTIRVMITELTTKKTQARAFSFFTFSMNLGMFFGPLIGGALSDPANQYGGIFKNIEWCKKYPYGLSTLATGAISLSAAIIVMIFIDETKKPKKVSDSDTESNASSSTTSLNKPEPKSTWDILRFPGVGMVLYLYCHALLLGFAYTAVVPVFWFTSPALGGFGFSPFYISIFMGLTGFAQACWLLFVFPPLHKRVGTGGILKICGTAYPFIFIPLPFLNSLLRMQNPAATQIFWIITPPILVIMVGTSMVFTATQLAINDISPNPETLGLLNAFALTLVSGMRAFSPWMFTSLFAIGVGSQIMGGYLIWFILVILAALYAVAVRWLPPQAAGNGHDDDE